MTRESDRSGAWRAVDASGETEDMVAYLDRAAAATSALRAESLALLEMPPGAVALDAGCGTGVAAIELADIVGPSGLVYALDPSEAMVRCTGERAASRPIEARVGDIRSIDLPDDSCDGARTERVLIHLTGEEMRAAIGELARVVRPGGRIALVETCHAQCRIAGDGLIMPSVAEAVANATAGLDMRAALLAAGCDDVQAHPRPLAFSSIRELHPVVRLEVVARAATRLGVTEDEVAAALAAQHRRDQDGIFFAVIMFYIAAGTVRT